jgi:hypothetical protein
MLVFHCIYVYRWGLGFLLLLLLLMSLCMYIQVFSLECVSDVCEWVPLCVVFYLCVNACVCVCLWDVFNVWDKAVCVSVWMCES